MLGKRMGLFGSARLGNSVMPGDQPDYGWGDMGGLFRVPTDGGPSMPAEQPKSGGFFGQGGIGRGIAGTVGDWLQQVNGLEPTYGPSMLLQRQQQLASQRAKQQRSQEWEDWQRKQEWERNNPKPVNNDTINDFNWFKNLSPEDRALYGQMKPQYITADNGDGTKTVIPVTPGMFGGQQAAPVAPTAPVGKLRPIGGGSGGNVGGGFRPGY